MIDEVNAIMESLIQYLKDCLKNNKKKFKKEEKLNEEGDNVIMGDYDNDNSGSFPLINNSSSNNENNSGLTYNEELFYVDYQSIGSNIYPDITIIRLAEDK